MLKQESRTTSLNVLTKSGHGVHDLHDLEKESQRVALDAILCC